MIGSTSTDDVTELLHQIYDSRAVLFLGAGSTRACLRPDGKPGLDGSGLAREILTDLNSGVSPPFDATLTEASEFYSTVKAGTRGKLDRLVQDRLRNLQPTIGHYLAASFPWRAVVTTNYNSVTEDAWATAHAEGFAARELITIRTDDDIQKHEGDTSRIRLYKPHGCITIHMNQGARMVLTSEDYYKSKKVRAKIYDAIRSISRECTTLFVGYSLADYTFKNLFYDLNAELGGWASRSYSIGPDDQSLRFGWRSKSMDRAFNTTLINDYFDTFMLRLSLARGTLTSRLNERVVTTWSQVMTSCAAAAGNLDVDAFKALPTP